MRLHADCSMRIHAACMHACADAEIKIQSNRKKKKKISTEVQMRMGITADYDCGWAVRVREDPNVDRVCTGI